MLSKNAACPSMGFASLSVVSSTGIRYRAFCRCSCTCSSSSDGTFSPQVAPGPFAARHFTPSLATALQGAESRAVSPSRLPTVAAERTAAMPLSLRTAYVLLHTPPPDTLDRATSTVASSPSAPDVPHTKAHRWLTPF